MKHLHAFFILLSCVFVCKGQHVMLYGQSNPPKIITDPIVPPHIQAIRERSYDTHSPKNLPPGRIGVDISYLANNPDAWDQRLLEFGVFIACPYNYDHTPYSNAPCPCMLERAQKIAEERARQEAQRQLRLRAEQEAQDRLKQEIAEKVRLEAEQKKCEDEQQKALQIQYNTQCDTSLETLIDTANSFEQELDLYDDNQSAKQRYKNRIQAIRSLAHNKTIYTEIKVIDHTLETRLAHHAIDATTWKSCTGNALQQVLHNEFIKIGIDGIKYIPLARQDQEALLFLISDAGCGYNQTCQVIKSMTIADWCWSFLDCIQAAGEGIGQGIDNTLHSFRHPIQTIQNITSSITTLAHYTGKLLFEIGDMTILLENHRIEGVQRCQEFNTQCNQVLTIIADQYNTIKARDVIKAGTAYLTEPYLQNKILLGLHTLFSAAQKTMLTIAHEAEMLPTCEELIISAQGLELSVAAESFHHMAVMQQDRIRKGGRAVLSTDRAIIKVRNMQEFFETTAFGKMLKDKVINKSGIYTITEKIKHPYLAKGDVLYLDKLHYDHLEVFRNQKIKCVLNLDGKINEQKTILARTERRKIRT